MFIVISKGSSYRKDILKLYLFSGPIEEKKNFLRGSCSLLYVGEDSVLLFRPEESKVGLQLVMFPQPTPSQAGNLSSQ